MSWYRPFLLMLATMAPLSSAMAQNVWSDEQGDATAQETPEGARTLAPLAFVSFCMREPQDCATEGSFSIVKASLSPTSENDLWDLNRAVNRSIRPRHKANAGGIGRWAIGPASGDCNDYAVTKRHELLRSGWSPRSLLLAEVETSWGEGHLVLLVRTGTGDMVLDNLSPRVRPWSETDYRWIKRQSAVDPRQWVEMKYSSPTRVEAVAQLLPSWPLRLKPS